ncbi:ABC transporter permease [Stenotrophomonas sp. MMGLT7]|uniref:ABC transporter permease n=1 Tax=Stenotrophomonas sp. MMGLT7 TaxID=2901227 RepID=UPI001E38F4AB|nr:ABC transporter permease [Stenotrophomonas sp. MMGLT7]MCD7097477.1 ABC transporter permease [Stenotrophomonas sp. MMGLT7]
MSRARIWIDEAGQAWRGLLRRPGYLLLAALTLALGVATSTTVFALIDQALLKPLPFPQAERLVTLGMQMDDVEGLAGRNAGAPGYYPPTKRMRSLAASGMSLGFTRNSNIARGDVAEVVPSLSADRGFLQTLGVQPLLGRNFSEEEDRPDGPQAAILGYELWRQRLGGDPEIVGKTLLVEGRTVPIVGVLPSTFVWPDRFDLMLPLQPDPGSTSTATNQHIVGRLAADASLAGATAEADAAMRRVAAGQMTTDRERGFLQRMRFTALPLHDSIFASRSGRALWMFLAAALCVLAIAAFNLGNLMLLRALTRDHDTAVRAAMGAPAARLALPAFAEALLVGVLGALGGVVLSWIGLRLLGSWVPLEWLRGQPPALSASAIGFASMAGVAVALTGAMLGAWRGRRRAALADIGREGQSGLGRGGGQLARGLIVVQVAAAAMLLLCASLFAHSLHRLSQVPMGFESRSIVTFTLSPVRGAVGDIAEVSRQARGVLQALERESGAALAGASTNLPTASQFNNYMEFPDGRGSGVQYRPVSAGFLDVFGIPLLAGRGFDATLDRVGSESVGVVSQAFAREYLGGDALGKIVRVAEGENAFVPVRVVGVVGDVRQYGPAEPAPPVLYVALGQLSPQLWGMLREYMPLQYAVQVRPGMETALMRRLPELVRQVSPGQPITDVQTMQAVVASTTRDQKLNLLLVGVFSALALLLAAVGLYAVMAVSVAARRHEFGVRAALGAPPARLLRQVLGESARQLALGLAIGLAVALASARLLQRFLFGVDAADPLAIAVVVAVLAASGLLATLVPALRAARVHPMQALRME